MTIDVVRPARRDQAGIRQATGGAQAPGEAGGGGLEPVESSHPQVTQ